MIPQLIKDAVSNLRNKAQNGISFFILGNNEAPANYRITHINSVGTVHSLLLQCFSPGYAGVIDIETDKDYFFGNDVDMDDIIWMGPQPSAWKELAAQVGIEKFSS